jgi:hypothetical protein
MYGQPRDVLATQFDLAGVKAGPDLDAAIANSGGDRDRRSHRSAWAIKHSQEAVASRVHFPAAEAFQLRPDDIVVSIQLPSPKRIPRSSRSFGRSDDVGEEHGC